MSRNAIAEREPDRDRDRQQQHRVVLEHLLEIGAVRTGASTCSCRPTSAVKPSQLREAVVDGLRRSGTAAAPPTSASDGQREQQAGARGAQRSAAAASAGVRCHREAARGARAAAGATPVPTCRSSPCARPAALERRLHAGERRSAGVVVPPKAATSCLLADVDDLGLDHVVQHRIRLEPALLARSRASGSRAGCVVVSPLTSGISPAAEMIFAACGRRQELQERHGLLRVLRGLRSPRTRRPGTGSTPPCLASLYGGANGARFLPRPFCSVAVSQLPSTIMAALPLENAPRMFVFVSTSGFVQPFVLQRGPLGQLRRRLAATSTTSCPCRGRCHCAGERMPGHGVAEVVERVERLPEALRVGAVDHRRDALGLQLRAGGVELVPVGRRRRDARPWRTAPCCRSRCRTGSRAASRAALRDVEVRRHALGAVDLARSRRVVKYGFRLSRNFSYLSVEQPRPLRRRGRGPCARSPTACSSAK